MTRRKHRKNQEETPLSRTNTFRAMRRSNQHLYVAGIVSKKAFTNSLLYKQRLSHTEALTHRRFYTQALLHTGAFTHRSFYTQTVLHTHASTHRSFRTLRLLHRHLLTGPKPYCSILFTREPHFVRKSCRWTS